MPQLPIPEHQSALLAFISLNQLLFFSIRGCKEHDPHKTKKTREQVNTSPKLLIKPHYLEGLDDGFFVSLLVTARHYAGDKPNYSIYS